MTALQQALFALRDETYAAFQQKLLPTVAPETVIGVRVPALRQIAATFEKTPDCEDFLKTLPHAYYEENLLHAVLLSRRRPFEACLADVTAFFPYVDNWAVCDTLRPKVFARRTEALLPYVQTWIASSHTYTCRFGIDMLMTYYADEHYLPEYAAWPAAVRSDEYYVNMMIAWYYATLLAKQWDTVIPYLQEKRLPVWVHNKTIQKARESFRITPDQKEYLQGLRI